MRQVAIGCGPRVVCERCHLADRHLSRLKGLLGRRELEPGEGMLLRPASSIHTCFMRFPIDAVFLDRDLRVLRVVAGLKPWRIATVRGAHAVLELPAGECRQAGIRPGDRLTLADLVRPLLGDVCVRCRTGPA